MLANKINTVVFRDHARTQTVSVKATATLKTLSCVYLPDGKQIKLTKKKLDYIKNPLTVDGEEVHYLQDPKKYNNERK